MPLQSLVLLNLITCLRVFTKPLTKYVRDSHKHVAEATLALFTPLRFWTYVVMSGSSAWRSLVICGGIKIQLDMLLSDLFLQNLFFLVWRERESLAEEVDDRGRSQSSTFRTYAMWRAPGGQCINYQTCHIQNPPSSPPHFYLPAGALESDLGIHIQYACNS